MKQHRQNELEYASKQLDISKRTKNQHQIIVEFCGILSHEMNE